MKGAVQQAGKSPLPVKAFTLVEMVISAAVMSLILVAAYLCLRSGFLSQKLVDSRSEVLQAGRVAIGLIAADLRSASPLSSKAEFVGMTRSLGDVQADNLDFATHNYTPRRPGEGDWCELSYFVAASSDGQGLSLWRRRDPLPDDEPFSGGMQEEIAPGLRGLQFEYYDGIEWFSDWGDPNGRGKQENSRRDHPNLYGMPEAVRVTLSLGPARRHAGDLKKEEEEPALVFQTICRLNLAGVSSSSGLTGSASRSEQSGATQPDGGGQ